MQGNSFNSFDLHFVAILGQAPLARDIFHQCFGPSSMAGKGSAAASSIGASQPTAPEDANMGLARNTISVRVGTFNVGAQQSMLLKKKN